MECGFSSSSDFSRTLKQRYEAAPSAFDIEAWREKHGAELEVMVSEAAGRRHLGRVPAARNPDGFRVKIRDLPARTVAYIRVSHPYRGDAVAKATQRLIAWAERNSLADGQWLGYQWDTPRSRRRTTASITWLSKPSDSSPSERSAGSGFRPMRSRPRIIGTELLQTMHPAVSS